jgi:hypothetical protein
MFLTFISERKRGRQTDRQTDRQIDRQADRWMDRQTEIKDREGENIVKGNIIKEKRKIQIDRKRNRENRER